MTTFTLAWILLILFGLINVGMAYVFLKQRGRMNLIWIILLATGASYLLFALFPGALALLAFPIFQLIGFQALLRMAPPPPVPPKK